MTLLAIAHRAGNSVAGLRDAVDLGVDVVEADVHHHRGRLEVRHLKTMGPLPWLWDRWALYPASTPRLPLADLLAAADPAVPLMLDLKGRNPATGRAVAREVSAAGAAATVLACSRYWRGLRAVEAVGARVVRSARNRWELAALVRRPAGEPRGYAVSVHRSLLDPAVVATLHERVEVVMTWPVNDVDALEQVVPLAAIGPIGVISDDPAILARVTSLR